MSRTKKPNRLSTFLATKTGRTLFHVIYSVGAGIVILGALAKINHFPLGFELLTIGMITEAFVFIISAFDTDQVDYDGVTDEGGVTVIGGVAGSAIGGATSGAGIAVGSKAIQTHPGRGGTTIIGGGGVVGGGGFVGGGTGETMASGGGSVGGSTIPDGINREGVSGGVISGAGGGSSFNTNNFSPEYIEQMTNMAKEMESFSKAMSSFMAGYNPAIDGGDAAQIGLFENIKVLNENVVNINKVYEEQLKSVGNQISTTRYINESLERIRSLYDNTVMDSNAFKMENEKMTRQIQELNKVYARLLHAMNAGGGYNPTSGGYNPSL